MDEALKYFKENEGYSRLFEKMKSKFETYEKEMAGTVLIENPTEAEREALGGFMKRNYRKCKVIQIKIAVFQQKLNETKFAGIKVKELVQEYFGLEIITKKTKRQMQELAMQEFFENLLKKEEGKRTYSILKNILEEKKEEFSILKQEYKSSRKKCEKALENTCLSIDNLPNKKVLLPVFSAQITGNPHELDRKNLTGRLFIMLLSSEEQVTKPKAAEEVAEFYYRHNLVIDEVSNMVLCKNIVGMIGADTHKGWLGFCENGEAMQITLAGLSKITGVTAKRKEAIIVENPAVFTALSTMNSKVPLVCTYGQVKLSGLVLLDYLVEAKIKLYYSGDTDPEGIQIADKLKSRYQDNIELVGFDSKTYFDNLSKEGISGIRRKKLYNIKNQELRDVSFWLQDIGLAAYEENKIDLLTELVEKIDKDVMED